MNKKLLFFYRIISQGGNSNHNFFKERNTEADLLYTISRILSGNLKARQKDKTEAKKIVRAILIDGIKKIDHFLFTIEKLESLS